VQKKKYLFVTGCPRSGTSVLALLLGRHPKIAMGIERFHNYVIPEFTLQAHLFDKNRFFDFQKNDSHINLENQPNIKTNYDLIETRYDESTYFGDKIPYLYRYYNQLIKEFNQNKNLKIIFIFRNIIDVANSYEIKNNKPNSIWRRDYKVAIRDWNNSMRLTEKLKTVFPGVFSISYESLFLQLNFELLNSVLEFLELERNETFDDFYKEIIDKSNRLQTKRKSGFCLDSNQIHEIFRNSNILLYKKFLNNS